MATGVTTAKLPDWAKQIAHYPPERLCHAQSVHLPALPTLVGETILIVGGWPYQRAFSNGSAAARCEGAADRQESF